MRTNDIYLVAALMSNGYELETVEHEDSRSYFIIKEEPSLETALNDYTNDRMTLRARMFIDNLRALKLRL